MEGKEEHQHASGGVTPVMFRPAVVDVLEEGRIVDLHLVGQTRVSTGAPAMLPLASSRHERAPGTLGNDEVTGATAYRWLWQ